MKSNQKQQATCWDYYPSPVGLIELGCTNEALLDLNFVENKQHPNNNGHPLLKKVVAQLEAYFNNGRFAFDLPLQPQGTPFQQSVWQQLLTVPASQAASYSDIAHAINKPKAVRAVGAANGQNPISIIIPCHRIIGSNGNLTGYGGGLWRKEWLLKHEGYLLL